MQHLHAPPPDNDVAPAAAPRIIQVRYIVEACRPDLSVAARDRLIRLAAVDGVVLPRLAPADHFTASSMTPLDAMRRVVRRLDLHPTVLAVAPSTRWPGCPFVWGPCERPVLHPGEAEPRVSSQPTPLAELTTGFTLAEARAALAAIQAAPHIRDDLPFFTVAEVHRALGVPMPAEKAE